MRSPVTVVFLFLLPVPVAAQVSATIVAATDLVSQTGSDLQVVPAGTDVSSGVLLSTSGSGAGCSSAATLGLRAAASAAGASVDLSAVANNGTTFFCGAPSASARGQIRITLTAPVATPGTLEIRASGFATGFLSSAASAFADLDDDGDIEISAPGVLFFPVPPENTLRLPVVLDATGLVVRAGVDGITNMGNATAGIVVTFTPGFADLELAGSPCGASLTVLDHQLTSGRRLDYEASTAAGTPFAFFVFGVTPTLLPIPPTGCPLRTDLLLAVPAALGPNGEALLGVPVGGLRGTVQAQFLSATPSGGATLWNTSERVRVTL